MRGELPGTVNADLMRRFRLSHGFSRTSTPLGSQNSSYANDDGQRDRLAVVYQGYHNASGLDGSITRARGKFLMGAARIC